MLQRNNLTGHGRLLYEYSPVHQVSVVCVVVPTYNEAMNIRKLLDAVFSKWYGSPAKAELHVLVVDDNSPDGTAGMVREYQKWNPNVHLLWRTAKSGLGAAYISGMQYAMELLNPDVIIEMDADFSHNPADLYRLVEKIQEGADFVVGSRYVEGASLPESWGLHRRIVSLLSNMMTKLLLRIHGVKDCTGGFRAIHADVLRKINLGLLKVKGYAFQAVILEEAIRNGARVKEIPISFSERSAGKSKMAVKDLVEGGLILLQLRFGIAASRNGRRRRLHYIPTQ